jgi:hypothetical protein
MLRATDHKLGPAVASLKPFVESSKPRDVTRFFHSKPVRVTPPPASEKFAGGSFRTVRPPGSPAVRQPLARHLFCLKREQENVIPGTVRVMYPQESVWRNPPAMSIQVLTCRSNELLRLSGIKMCLSHRQIAAR